jgi:hypothetical protein
MAVRGAVRSDPRLLVGSWRLSIDDLPDWVTPEIRQELEAIRLDPPAGRLSVVDVGVLEEVTARAAACAWVQEVEEARLIYPTREAPGTLVLRLRLRQPVAVVEQGGTYHLSDAEARRLGGSYAESPAAWFRVPLVVGLPDPNALPPEGEQWASQDVRQGVEVARVLQQAGILRDFQERPLAIDLSNLHGRLNSRQAEIVLWQGRQKLAWGRSPLSTAARTVSVEDLVANLRWVLSHPESFGDFAEIHLHRAREHLTGVRG